jgi:hypothetical protein
MGAMKLFKIDQCKVCFTEQGSRRQQKTMKIVLKEAKATDGIFLLRLILLSIHFTCS